MHDDNDDDSCTSASPNILNILLWVFIILKLTGVIDWPWYFVLAPIWIPLVFVLLLAALFGLRN